MPPAKHAAILEAANRSLIAEGDVAAIPDYFTPDYTAHISGRTARGHAFLQRFITELRESFDNPKVEVEVLLTMGVHTAWQRTIKAKHTANYKGFPPTNRTITWHELFITRFDGTRIAEDHASSNLAEQLLAAKR